MKSQRIGLTALITLLTTVLTPFAPNLTILPVYQAFSQPAPSSDNSPEACDVRSESMSRTIEINEHVLINKIAYRSQSPKHGDIIVFNPTKTIRENNLSTNLGGPLIRRVIGLPGETVKVVNGKVFINNQPLKEKYIKEKPDYLFAPVTIPSNSYFVLGDNRNDSYDSHLWGFVPQDLIIGQVVRIVKLRSPIQQKELKSEVVNPSSSTGCNLF